MGVPEVTTHAEAVAQTVALQFFAQERRLSAPV